MQVGLKHVYFWQIETGGRNMTFKKAIVGRKGKLQAFLSAVFLNTGGEFGTPNFLPVAGTADGHLYLFEDNELTKTIKAHESFVNSLVATKSGLLLSAARDGLVKLWKYTDDEMENTHTFDIRNCKGSLYTRLRAVDVDEDNNKILVGTQGSEIYEVSERSERALRKTRILAMNPAKWLQTATSTTELIHSIRFGSLVLLCFIKMHLASLGAAQSRRRNEPQPRNRGADQGTLQERVLGLGNSPHQ